MTGSDPAPGALHEAVLYVADLAAAAAFYAEIVGLRLVVGPTAALAAFRVGAGVLLLFDPAEAEIEGREVPSHGARGPGHVALSVDEAALAATLERFAANGVDIEREITWPAGGRSVYVRDPAGNSLELVAGEIWPA